MYPAIAHFTEAYAWLIRGLLDQGWEDLSLAPNTYPMNNGFGFSIEDFMQTGGQYGLRLIILARDAEGAWFDRDGAYEFYARHYIDHWNQVQFLLYSKDTGFHQSFPFQTGTPDWISRHIHQAALTHIPEFVEKRKQNHTVGPSTLSQIPDPRPLLCSADFMNFFILRYQSGLSLNQARIEGLIYDPPPVPSEPNPQSHIQSQANTANPYGGGNSPGHGHIPPPNMNPMGSSGIGLGMGVGNQRTQGQDGASFAGSERSIAMQTLIKPVLGLRVIMVMGILMGILGMLNAIATVFMARANTIVLSSSDYIMPIVGSIIVSTLCLVGAIFSHFGLNYYREAKEHPLAYAPITYAALVPFCNFTGGMVIALWALWVWNKDEVKAARKG